MLKKTKRSKNIPDELIDPIDEYENIADGNNPETIFFEREAYESLAETIRLELSTLEYEVLQLYLSGESYSYISEKLGISLKSVGNALSRIRKKLKG